MNGFHRFVQDVVGIAIEAAEKRAEQTSASRKTDRFVIYVVGRTAVAVRIQGETARLWIDDHGPGVIERANERPETGRQ